jgi:protein-tyrosine-phosphatase
MAEAIARERIREREWSHVRTRSAGTSAVIGAPASEGAREAAAEVGLDLSGHRTTPLTPEEVAEADIVVVMTAGHRLVVEEMGGAGKATLLSEFIEGAEPGEPIEDPFGGSATEFAHARERIAKGISGLLDRLESILAP